MKQSSRYATPSISNYCTVLIARLLVAYLPLAASLLGCNFNPSRRQEFLQKFANDDFIGFKHITIFSRGSNKDGDAILVLTESRLDSTCSDLTPLTFIRVNKETQRVKSLKNNFTAPCLNRLSEARIRQLATKFVRYRVQAITVNSYDNVFITLQPFVSEPAELVRITNRKPLKSYFWQDYVPIKGSWYKRKTID